MHEYLHDNEENKDTIVLVRTHSEARHNSQNAVVACNHRLLA